MFIARRLLVILFAVTGLACAPLPSPPRALAADVLYAQNLQVDPLHPDTLFLEGQIGCTDSDCYHWAERSLDGGATWTDFTGAIERAAPAGQHDVDFDPLLPAGGRTLVTTLYIQPDASPDAQSWYLIASHDWGATWAATGPTGGYVDGHQYGYAQPATDVRAPGWIYALYNPGADADTSVSLVVRSRDGGKTWATGSDIAGLVGGSLGTFVLDPAAPTTVYGNCADQSCVIRSLDGGTHWATVPFPKGRDMLTVSFDAHEPGLLVGRSTDAGVPRDRIYLSADHGANWRPARCPGDLRGACPAFVLDDVFGRGRAYGFYKDGIHPFSGAGAAGPRLAISSQLPAPAGHILAVGAGIGPGTPVYLLVSGRRGTFADLVYRSVDGGLHWHLARLRA